MYTRLPKAIKSVKELDYKNIELIIVDDGSDEKPFAGISEELSLEDRIEVKFLPIAHAGKPTAVNCGFKEATGEYVIILDADDLLPKNSVSSRVKALENSNADLCVGSFEIMYDSKIKGRRRISKLKSKDLNEISTAILTKIISPFHQNSMMFSAELLAETGGMNPKMKRGQDKDFAIKLLQKSRKTVFIDGSVYMYNIYHRPIKVRLYNRFTGTKYKLITIARFFKGKKRVAYLAWVTFINTLKMGYDVFWVYKK